MTEPSESLLKFMVMSVPAASSQTLRGQDTTSVGVPRTGGGLRPGDGPGPEQWLTPIESAAERVQSVAASRKLSRRFDGDQ